MKPSDFKAVLKHCRNEYPREACGIMKGRISIVDGEKIIEVQKVYRTQNIHPNPMRGYKIHPKDQYRVYVEVDQDLELIGFYHSHPFGPHAPSPTDIKECNYPGYFFIIVSLEDCKSPHVSAWILYEDRVEKKKLVIST